VDPAATDPSDLRMIHQVMASLDAMNRSLMLLYLDGYAAADIAHMLGISETNVTTRISRVKQQIQQTFLT
jgi:RNA polymerase sigma-70 factor (ECF subfamily)